MVEPEFLQAVEPLVTRRRRDHGRAGALRELDRRDADAARSGLDQHGLAGLQVAELEQAVVGGAERDRHARDAAMMSAPVGNRPGEDRRELAVSSACEPQRFVVTTR